MAAVAAGSNQLGRLEGQRLDARARLLGVGGSSQVRTESASVPCPVLEADDPSGESKGTYPREGNSRSAGWSHVDRRRVS